MDGNLAYGLIETTMSIGKRETERGPMLSWLTLAAIGIPLLSALVIRIGGAHAPRAARGLCMASLCALAILALVLFVANGKYACILAGGKQNCLFDGAALASLFLLCSLTAFGLFRQGPVSDTGAYVWWLLMVGGWVGMGLGENLLVFVVGLNVFGYALYRLLKHHDITWGFVVPFRGREPPEK